MLESIKNFFIHCILFIAGYFLSFTGIWDKPFDAEQFKDYENTVWISEDEDIEVEYNSDASELSVRLEYEGESLERVLINATSGMQCFTRYAFIIPDPEHKDGELVLFEMSIRVSEEEMVWYDIYSEEGTGFEDKDELIFVEK